MRLRTLLLLVLAVILAGSTAMLARSWLAAQRSREVAAITPPAPKPAKAVLVAKSAILRGQILRPEEMVWQVWPEGSLDKNYIVEGGPKKPETFSGWVATGPIAGGEPVTEAKIVAPGSRGYLAAVLRPGMRAISVPVTVTSGISGFIFPGDAVDLLLTYPIPARPAAAEAKQANYEHKAAETVLRNIRVIAIDQRLETKAGEAIVAHTATFEVTPKQSEVIALASEIGKVSLTLRSLVAAPHEKAPAEETRARLMRASTGDRSLADGATDEMPARLARASHSDSSIADSATYTIDSEISPLLPKSGSAKDVDGTSVVTILRGSGKKSEIKASEPAAKGL